MKAIYLNERIDPTTELAILKVIEREKSLELILEVGNKVREVWLNLAKHYGIDISLSGIPSLSICSFNYEDGLKYKTFLTQ
jgi:hypothetical protein